MINHIEIINWRAYKQQQIHFKPGITFIMGTNGKGKTSLLEAIAYALTGEPSTVTERGKLLRNSQQLATVRLSLTINGQPYLIERSQSNKRAEKAKLIRLNDQKTLASNHKQVTRHIEELMNVSADFLQRMTYMAEGDIYRFLKEASGKAIDRQIRQILGLTQMDEFLKALKLAGKAINHQIKSLQYLLTQLENLDIKTGTELQSTLEQKENSRQILLTKLKLVQDKISQLKNEEQQILYLKPLFEKIINTLQRNSEVWQTVQKLPMPVYDEQLQQQLQQLKKTQQTHDITQARLQGEQSAYQQILDVLLSEKNDEMRDCPVCHKSMTSQERETVVQKIEQYIEQLSIESQELDTQRIELTNHYQQFTEQIHDIEQFQTSLATHLKFKSLIAKLSLSELLPKVQYHQLEFSTILNELQQQDTSYQRMIAELEQQTAQFLAMQHRLQELGYHSPEQASDELVKLEIRSLTLRAAESATQESLGIQRNQNIQVIYEQIAKLWATFNGHNNWHVELDTNGMPKLKNPAGDLLDLSQLSGGEKTMLLLMLHTVIAHYFAQSDFILMDEPIAHLDPINRRSVIHFLMNLYQQGAFQQALITSFDESLIRKYLSAQGVNVIYL
jgi:ABC-type cobalamin/Fe3+-siderophores transport system ATPase subunit